MWGANPLHHLFPMPHKDKATAAAYQRKWQKRPIAKAQRKAYRSANHLKVREQKRIQRAGVTPTRSMPDRCECCGNLPVGKGLTLHLDHDHALKIFRGWLCHYCNAALGMARDNPLILRALAAYLETAWATCPV